MQVGKFGWVSVVSLSMLTLACGNDSASNSEISDDGREVRSVYDLGRCTSEREGDSVYVAEKMKDYLCINNRWVDVDSVVSSSSTPRDDVGGSSSSSVATSSSSQTSFSSSARTDISSSSQPVISSSSQTSSSSSSRMRGSSSSIAAESGSSSGKEIVSSSSTPRDDVDGSSSSVATSSSSLVATSSSEQTASSSSQVATSSSSQIVSSSSSQTSSSSSLTVSSSSVSSSSSVAESCSSVVSSSSVASSSSVGVVDPATVVFGELEDSRDKQKYKTVTIGSQTWMAENLNFNYIVNDRAHSLCYKNYSKNCDTYGRLYSWSAAVDSAAVFSEDAKGCGYGKSCSHASVVHGVCPENWHLPSYSEWRVLFNAVGGIEVAGRYLKSNEGWITEGGLIHYANTSDDNYGFTILPAGSSDGFNSIEATLGRTADFWSATLQNTKNANYVHFRNDEHKVYAGTTQKSYAFSVRCVKD